MPRLVEINTTCNAGSTGRIAEAIGKLAQSQGWDVLYIHGGRYINPSHLATYQVQPRWMDYLHYLLSLLTGHHGLFSTFATRRMIRRLKQFQPDIIHLHNIHGYYLNYEILFSYLREAHIPVVWTWHDCWPMTGHCAYPSTETGHCDAWKTECRHCPKLSDYPRSLVDKTTYDFRRKKRCFSSIEHLTIVPVSRWLEEKVRQSYLHNTPTCVIHNGINLNTFYLRANRQALRKKWGIAQDAFILLGVAAPWNARKGYQDVLSLANLEGCQVIMVGLSHQQKLSLPQNIIGFERTESAEDLAELYTLADLFVNPTYSDTFPTTNLEALACGTPVLTYHTDGSPETINDLVGKVVEQGNIQALQDAIRDLQRHPINRQTCAAFAQQEYNQDVCFQAYIQLYNQLLKI